MNKIEAVIFDVGRVLHEGTGSETADDVSQELKLDHKTIKKIWAKYIPLLGSGEIDEVEFWRRVSGEYGTREVEVAENLLGRAFAETLQPHLPVIELVKELGVYGVKRAILSNTIEPHAKVLQKAGLYDGFDHVFLSHEVKMRKPDPAIYQHALAVMAIEPETALFVDDRRENVEAAEALGIHGIIALDPQQIVSNVRSYFK